MTSTWPAVILLNRTAYTCSSVERLLFYHHSAHVWIPRNFNCSPPRSSPLTHQHFPNATQTSMDDDRDKDPDLPLLAAAGWCPCSSYALARQPELPGLDTVHLGPGPWAQRAAAAPLCQGLAGGFCSATQRRLVGRRRASQFLDNVSFPPPPPPAPRFLSD